MIIRSNDYEENYQRSNHSNLRRFEVTPPKWYKWVLGMSLVVISFLVLSSLVIVILYYNKDVKFILNLIGLFVFDLILIYSFINCFKWKLQVSDKITLKRFLRKDVVFDLNDISKVKKGYNDTTIKLNNRITFNVENNYNYSDLFLTMLKVKTAKAPRKAILNNGFMVYRDKNDFFIYIFFTMFFMIILALIIYFLLDEFSFINIVGLIMFSLLQIFISYCFFIETAKKIMVCKDKIVLKRYFKQDKSFAFKDIDYATKNGTTLTIYINDGDKFTILTDYIAGEFFEEYLRLRQVIVR